MSNNMKLIMNNWRNLILEADLGVDPQGQPNPQIAQQLDKIIKMPYEDFVNNLKNVAGDARVQAVLKYGLKDGKPDDEKVKAVPLDVLVSRLRPTQNEIALDKSLGGQYGPLENKDVAELFLAGSPSNPVLVPSKIKGAKVATAYNGLFIVDGHHRWSSLFCVNSSTAIQCIDLTIAGMRPVDYLKVVQLAIAADIQNVPVATAKGSLNLITIQPEQLKQYVIQNLKEELIPVYARFNKGRNRQEIAENIWRNVSVMQQKCKPVKGSPPRDFMPQTDDASGWVNRVASGEINFKDTFDLAGHVSRHSGATARLGSKTAPTLGAKKQLREINQTTTGFPQATTATAQTQQDPVAGVLNTLLATLKAKNITGYESQIRSAIQGKTAVQALSAISNILVNVLSHKNTTAQTGQDSLKTSLTPANTQGQPAAAPSTGAMPKQ